MRYIIQTLDNEGTIGAQIAKWQKDKLLEVIEKGEPIIEMKAELERVVKALDILQKSGYNSEVMKIWLCKKTGLGLNKIGLLLDSQMEFFKAIGVKI